MGAFCESSFNNQLGCDNNITPEEMDAENWGMKLININFKHVLSLWDLRNKELHGTTPEQIEKNKVIRYLEEEIQYIQERNQDCCAADRDWLLENLMNYVRKTVNV